MTIYKWVVQKLYHGARAHLEGCACPVTLTKGSCYASPLLPKLKGEMVRGCALGSFIFPYSCSNLAIFSCNAMASLLTSGMRHPKFFLRSNSGLMARCSSVRKRVLVCFC